VITISAWNFSEIDKALGGDREVYSFATTCEALWMPYWREKIGSFLID
jgi:hypothetical protein